MLGWEGESAIEPLVSQKANERARNMWMDEERMIDAASDDKVPGDGVRLYERSKSEYQCAWKWKMNAARGRLES